MYPIKEIVFDHIDDQGFIHFDAYFTDDENEQGVTLAIMHQDNQAVYYLDPRYSQDTKLVQAIEEAKVTYKKTSKLYSLLDVDDETYFTIIVKNPNDQTESRLAEVSNYFYVNPENEETGDMFWDGADELCNLICIELNVKYGYECEQVHIKKLNMI